jgi:hypothetical protein
MYSNQLNGGVSTQAVQVLEVTSAASAAGYVSRVPRATDRAFVLLTCSYRNLVVIVVGANRVASVGTLGRITKALQITAPRGDIEEPGGACGQLPRLDGSIS